MQAATCSTDTTSGESWKAQHGPEARRRRAEERNQEREAVRKAEQAEKNRTTRLSRDLRGRGISHIPAKHRQIIIDTIGQTAAFRWNVIPYGGQFAARHSQWPPTRATVEGSFEEILALVKRVEGK